MRVTHIFSQANANVEIEFRAMERSLRATGCKAPLKVIPFGDNLFELPRNAEWVPINGLLAMLNKLAKHPCHLRYCVLTESSFQYADADIIFLQDPVEVLAKHSGFVATCPQWQLPHFAVTPTSLELFRTESSTWQLKVFNSGQFACENALFTTDGLLAALMDPKYKSSFFKQEAPWDQPGFNLLVHLAAPQFTNITLPPHNMQSTWAGDYGEDPQQFWAESQSMPYLIHFAGGCLYLDSPINGLFLEYLTKDEKALFLNKRRQRLEAATQDYRNGLTHYGRLSFDLKRLIKRFSPGIASRARKWINEGGGN